MILRGTCQTKSATATVSCGCYLKLMQSQLNPIVEHPTSTLGPHPLPSPRSREPMTQAWAVGASMLMTPFATPTPTSSARASCSQPRLLPWLQPALGSGDTVSCPCPFGVRDSLVTSARCHNTLPKLTPRLHAWILHKFIFRIPPPVLSVSVSN